MGLSKILYVEDDDDIRAVTLLSLEMLGDFVVEACASGVEAVERAATFAPDLILLDVMMPGLDGPATLARLRAKQELATVPAVFFTAKTQPDEVRRLRELGAQDVLAKPFDPERLPGELQRIWEAARMGDAFAEKFAELGRTFRAQLPMRLQEMERLAAAGPEADAELRAIAHRIAGQSGTFGAPEISRAAAAVEDADPSDLADVLTELSRVVQAACR